MIFWQKFFLKRRKKLLNNLLTDVNFLDWHHRRERRNLMIRVGVVISLVIMLTSGWLILTQSARWIQPRVQLGLTNLSANTSPRVSAGGLLMEKLLGNFNGASVLINFAQFSGEFLGFYRPRTYLVLLENNAEIRPAGGFIGYYMVLEINKGKVKILESADSYVLDRYAIDKLKVTPPAPLTTYNNVKYWYLRDANWSPDFMESATKALWFYQEESKLSPESAQVKSFDGVIAFTPTFIQKVLGIVGELKVDDKVFNQDNFIEELQYYVEIGYQTDTADWYQRKSILKKLAKTLLNQVQTLPVAKKLEILGVVQANLSNKQILLYSLDANLQKFLEKNNYAGRIVKNNDQSDYLMVVDANLASLKTDLKVKRSISYQVMEDSQYHDWIGTVTVKYNHEGTFNWSTTRYRSYVRVYLPAGSEIVGATYRSGAKINDRQPYEVIPYDIPSDKTVVGSFISLEPGTSGELSISYFLPSRIQKFWRENGGYQLIWQKQAGTGDYPVKFDFQPTNVLKLWNGILSKDLTVEFRDN